MLFLADGKTRVKVVYKINQKPLWSKPIDYPGQNYKPNELLKLIRFIMKLSKHI